jgi:hypothetical protein
VLPGRAAGAAPSMAQARDAQPPPRGHVEVGPALHAIEAPASPRPTRPAPFGAQPGAAARLHERLGHVGGAQVLQQGVKHRQDLAPRLALRRARRRRRGRGRAARAGRAAAARLAALAAAAGADRAPARAAGRVDAVRLRGTMGKSRSSGTAGNMLRIHTNKQTHIALEAKRRVTAGAGRHTLRPVPSPSHPPSMQWASAKRPLNPPRPPAAA